MNTKAPDLLPCPFCGYHAKLSDPVKADADTKAFGCGDYTYGVECAADLECAGAICRFPDEKSAITAWNRRAPYPRAAFGGEATQAQGWQDISKAPRNPAGTFGHRGDLDVDLWHFKQGRVANCFWWEERGAWFARSGGMAYNMGEDDQFTHWMPLPASPEVTP